MGGKRATNRYSSNREFGIEALRLLSMLMIVTLHIMSANGGGGVLRCSVPFSTNWTVAWIIETISIQSVNCFGLISGYVLSGRSWSIKKYVEFWVMVFIMNIIVFSLSAILQWHSYSVFGIIKNSIPWYSDLWYVKAYLGLLLIIPLLNLVIEKYNDKRLYIAIGIIIIVPLIMLTILLFLMGIVLFG